MKVQLFRIVSYLRHRLTAWNTSGEGIHSPWLFHLVRFVLRDRNSYYCFSEIEKQRGRLLRCEDEIDVVDYGSCGSREGLVVRRRVCDIARGHLESPKTAQALFRIALYLGETEHRPLEILELGTSLGITTAYLSSADSRNRVVSLEGSDRLLSVAGGVWRALGRENIESHSGNIDDTLYIYARDSIDLAFIDANHTYEGTKRYTDCLLGRMTEKGVLVIDDIHHSEPMERAWEEIKSDARVSTTIDLWNAGLVFVDPHYLKRHYRVVL